MPEHETGAQYPIRVSEFVEMAEFVASFYSKIEVPAALQKVFDRVILARSKVTSWFEKGHDSDHGSNKRHSYFITVLEKAANLLKPLIPETLVVSESIKLQNRFAGLTVQETDPLDELIVEVKEKQLPKIEPHPIEQDEEGLEEDFFFAIATFLGEIYSVRAYIAREWDEYRQTGEGIARTAALSSTAVDLVRSAENQFDQMLVRPKKYTAKDYPIWTLPALLYIYMHDFFGRPDKADVDKLVKPSTRTRADDHECEQEPYCMFHVYTGLKLYLWIDKNERQGRLDPITPASFSSNAASIAPEIFYTLFWAQIFDIASHPANSHFAVDEATRGIKHMTIHREIPIWVTVAVQMFFDVEKVFEKDKTLAAPFRDYKDALRKASSDFSKIDPIMRPFAEQSKEIEQIPSIYQNLRGILKDHRDIANNDDWGRNLRKMKLETHSVLAKTVQNRDYVLERHPIRCGLLKYELQLQLNHRASVIEYFAADILYIAWLYVAGSKILHPDAPRWPDMEYLLYGREDKLFFGQYPKTLEEVGRKLELARGYSIANSARNRRSGRNTRDQKPPRRFQNSTVMGELFLRRLHAEHQSTAETHEWVTKLVSLVCKPESQKILDRQENLPEGTYDTSQFLKSMELQRKPVALLGEIRHWLIADENDLNFDWFGMLSTCTNIWNTIMPPLRAHALFKDDPRHYSSPGNTASRIPEAAYVGQNAGVAVPLFEQVWQTIQRTIQTPVSRESGRKTWIGDLRMAKLVDACNPAMLLMNPGQLNFLEIYANWSDDDKKESRVGRAVWYQMQAYGAKFGNKETSGESAEGEADGKTNDEEPVRDTPAAEDDLSKHSGSQHDGTDENDQADSDSDSTFYGTEFTIDLNALPRLGPGESKVIFMGNKMSKPVAMSGAQVSQLRMTPNGDFGSPGRAPRESSRVEMLPPRQSKRTRALATAEKAPELCPCGLSRYGVSVRQIPKMNTKAAKAEHQCMGALFEGIDVPNNDLSHAIQVRRVKIG